ncbi:hypothetical protein [Aneurinibacillus soli]|nr:hypothetical protein [Aneurinibacillus soli]
MLSLVGHTMGSDLRTQIEALLDHLPAKEGQIIRMRFGFDEDELKML